MLTVTHRAESLSRAYIQAIAGRCGMSCCIRDFDYGIDITVNHITFRGERRVESGFKLDIQAKSTKNYEVDETSVSYDMEVKTYNDLRDPKVGTPRILVVLCVPENEPDWCQHTEEHLLLRKCAYWMSLKGMPATTNKKTVRVSIPRVNRFNIETLNALMGLVRAGDEL